MIIVCLFFCDTVVHKCSVTGNVLSFAKSYLTVTCSVRCPGVVVRAGRSSPHPHQPPVGIDTSGSCYRLLVSKCSFTLHALRLSYWRHTHPLERSQHGSAYDHSQEQTEGEGDAHPLSVNRSLEITRATKSLISHIHPVGSIMPERRRF